MADIDLRIELDAPEASYRPGEVVNGRVVVRATQDTTCDGLSAKLEWFTHGKGNRDAGTGYKIDPPASELFKGQWRAGQEASYAFSFEVPALPLTYAGELLNVDYRVRAEADIPWTTDPSCERAIEIVYQPPPTGLQLSWDIQPNTSSASCLSCSCLFAAIGAFMVGSAVVSEEGSELLSIWGAVALLVGIMACFVFVGRVLAERKVGIVNIELERLGGGGYRTTSDDKLRGTLTAERKAKATKANAVLEVREEVRSGSGTTRRTFTHVLATSETTLDEIQNGRYEGTISLPTKAPYSFKAPNNQLLWELRCHIDIPNCPDWHESVTLEATPNS